MCSTYELRVDPFRQQYPKKRVWSFIGTGKAKNSRIDRVYINEEETPNITDMRYLQTPFGGHRILQFTKKGLVEHGKGYYKMNTSILKEPKHRELIENLSEEIKSQPSTDPIHKWQTFTMLAKSRSIAYSKFRNDIKRGLKNKLQKQIMEIEEKDDFDKDHVLDHYTYAKRRLKQLQLQEIEGYKKRLRLLAPYEQAEPDIAFYAKLQKKKISNDTIGQLAKSKEGEIFTDKKKLMEISTDFYKSLYTPNKVNTATQDKLLKNIKKKISYKQRCTLNARLSDEELRTAAFQLNKDKSPGLDGLPAEFYQEYWDIIKDLYIPFIREIKTKSIPKGKNASVIKLVYKNKGETFLLENYRPISLINVDIKILCKALANRLLPILPTIIHASQTAVLGRRIDQTVHLIRDLIDLANKEDDTVAFIFMDQEKAFDRVNHEFLYKTMKAFGIGENFINWIRTLYSNASAMINVNGFLTTPIPFNRGVRQGCPLSSMLYVMVIEILALQLRENPNIVGFQIEGEKIVSAHYMDDSTIIIKQNRCFKEVIKELTEYEEASGAKMNYSKTKGLWTGSWKGRRNTPMNIHWTSTNVKNLGVFFGNITPEVYTFNDIIPNVKKRLNYWKQFKLSHLGKARVVEMFLASTLIYAIKFYIIPTDIEKDLRQSILQYVNFPEKCTTNTQLEMWRLKEKGGIKSVNLQIKSEISKAKWLLELASNPELKAHLHIFKSIMGTQKGNISGRDLIFLEHSYIQRILDTNNQFYKEALLAITSLDIKKGISQVSKWNNEHIFYNKLFSLKNKNKVIHIIPYFQNAHLYTLDQFMEEKMKEVREQPYDRRAVSLYDKIVLNPYAKKKDLLVTNDGEEINLECITHKQLYEATISNLPGFHHSQIRWANTLNKPFEWDDIWYTVHNFLNTHKMTSLIWQQIHLNFYTTYLYNKWHQANDPCPLCGEIPQTRFHIMLHCETVESIWKDIEPVLLKLHPTQVSIEEKAFGIVIKRPKTGWTNRPQNRHGIYVRNWLTYLMRKCIAKVERKSHYSSFNITTKIKQEVHYALVKELDKKLFALHDKGNLKVFDSFFAYKNILCKKNRRRHIQDK